MSKTAGRIWTGRTAAGILYIAGIGFAAYIGLLIFNGAVYFDFSGLLLTALGVGLPLTAGTALLVYTMRDADHKYRTVRAYLLALFAFYVLLLFSLLFRSNFHQFGYNYAGDFATYLKWNSNFIPFKTIYGYILAYVNNTINDSSIIENLLGNLFLFAPMGFLLPSLFQKLRTAGRLIPVALAILVGVEALQLLLFCGSCDIDDVILNFAGLMLFYAFWRCKPIQNVLQKLYVLKQCCAGG